MLFFSLKPPKALVIFLMGAIDGYQVLKYLKWFEDTIEFKYCYKRGPVTGFLE